jgi:hypothetical protein
MIIMLLALVCGADAPLNDKVLEFARSKVGQKVGDGQCSTLAAQGLRRAGGRVRRGDDGTWGDELKSLLDVKPGDILQFDNALFTHTQFREDGAKITETRSFPHHTAIVARVRKRGTKPILVILHQNVGDSQIVQEWTLNVADKRRGTVKAYRPVPQK